MAATSAGSGTSAPRTRLYCPPPWLKAGDNEVVVFDLHKTEAAPLRGAATRGE
jgi:beta-galactosidase